MAPHPVAPLPSKLQLVSPSALKKPPKILIESINPHIICYLCKGYLIDATTIVECLHSFCHSCIMKHLQLENYCPRCEMLINKAKPNIKPDATLQAIVYKLVSGLYEKELKRKRAFYREHPYEAALATPEQRGDDTEHLIFSPNEQISLSLEYADIEEITPEDDENENIMELKHPKYLQCPANFPVAYLKKFVINKFNINVKDFYVEIMYKVKTIVLPDHFTLMDVAYIYTWKRDAPMRYFYRVRSHHVETEEVPEVPLRRSPPVQSEDDNTPIKSVSNEIDTTIIANSESDIIKVENKPVKPTHTITNSKNSDNNSANTSSSEVKKKSKKERNVVTNDNEKNDSLKLVIDLANQKVKESPSVNNCNKSSYNSEQCDNKDELKLKITKIHASSLPSPKTPSPKDKASKIKEQPNSNKLDASIEKPPKLHVGKVQDPEKVIEEKKFEFLNSFELTAKKSISEAKPTPSTTTTNSAAKLFTIPTTSSVHHTVTPTPNPVIIPDQPKIKITLSKNKPKQMTLSSMLKRKRMSSPNGSTPKVSYKIKNKKSTSVSPPLLISSSDTNRTTTTDAIDETKTISFSLSPFPIGSSTTTSPTKTNSTVTTSAPSDQKASDIQKGLLSNQEKKVTESRKSVSPEKSKEEKKSENKKTVGSNKITKPPTVATPEVVKNVGSKSNKSEGLMKPPQLPPPSSKRPQPILPKQQALDTQYSNKMMNLAGTEIKKLENNEKNKNIKVYGPSESKQGSKGEKMAPPLLSFTGGAMRNSMSGGYLNYALMNSSKTKMINGGGNGGDSPHPNHIPLSRMTPASHYAGVKSPRYAPSSPIYSPNSPQYSPNYNIPTQPQYKYMKSPVYASPNFLQNVMPPKKSPSKSSTPTTSSSSQSISTNQENNVKPGLKRQLSPLSVHPSTSKKSPKREKLDNTSPPPEKQAKVQSLLDSCKISLPSSLSITLTNDKDDQPASQLFNKQNSSPVNNYIEILKLSENNEDEQSYSESLKSVVEEKKLSKPIPNLTPMIKTSNNVSPNSEIPSNPPIAKTSYHEKPSYQDCYIQAMEKN